MKPSLIKLISLLLMCFAVNLFAQDRLEDDAFRNKVLANQNLMHSDVEAAYKNVEIYLKEAKEKGDWKAELYLLANRCRYFYLKENPNELIKSADVLNNRAKYFNDFRTQAVAASYIADAYSLNELYDEALEKLDESLVILDKTPTENENVINTRANIYVSIANIHIIRGEYQQAKEKTLLVRKEYIRLPKTKNRDYLFFLNSSNLAAAYLGIDVDSAELCAQKSIQEKPQNLPENDNVMFRNYIVLAVVFKERKDFAKALQYLNDAEKQLLGTGHKTDMIDLYEGFIEVYGLIGNKEKQDEYKSRLNEFHLEQAENKNQSLRHIIRKENKERTYSENKKNKQIWILAVSSVIVAALLTLLGFKLYQRKLYQKFDKLSQEYLNRPKEETLKEEIKLVVYNELVEMIKNNDPSFMVNFEKIFPDFSEKLLQVEPNLFNSEIEFCAFLKLNLSTKDIAQYKFIHPRTVQNKKYRIRKKLRIPETKDIYNWFDEL